MRLPLTKLSIRRCSPELAAKLGEAPCCSSLLALEIDTPSARVDKLLPSILKMTSLQLLASVGERGTWSAAQIKQLDALPQLRTCNLLVDSKPAELAAILRVCTSRERRAFPSLAIMHCHLDSGAMEETDQPISRDSRELKNAKAANAQRRKPIRFRLHWPVVHHIPDDGCLVQHEEEENTEEECSCGMHCYVASCLLLDSEPSLT